MKGERKLLDKDTIVSLLEGLRKRETEEITIAKEDFLDFRSVLVKEPDFKHFRGIAQHGGSVIYRFLNEPRS
ncbi:hypothetical protein [Bacillus pakistanensis]|uniref:hypothetical protein n=1 Tax=Rossellomorea pakistanensis TaxID=992288 RepID=UPI0019626D4D|nr:hypothetical protein [Bacillus pakistanensis]